MNFRILPVAITGSVDRSLLERKDRDGSSSSIPGPRRFRCGLLFVPAWLAGRGRITLNGAVARIIKEIGEPGSLLVLLRKVTKGVAGLRDKIKGTRARRALVYRSGC